MKLYELTDDIKGLMALADSEELTPEMIADTLEALESQFEDKARAILQVRQEMLNEVYNIEQEIKRLEKLKTAPQNNADQLTEYLRSNMETLHKDKIDCGTFKVTLRKPMKKLGMVDEASVPAKYWVEVPATRKIDRRALLSAAKEHELDYAPLVDGARSLQVR
jgi:hypothetical protein